MGSGVGDRCLADVEERADVRVIERRDGARFTLEPLAQIGPLGQM